MDEFVHLRRRTVVCSEDIAREKNARGIEQLQSIVEHEVESLIGDIVKGLNKNGGKWKDPDFYGDNALYRNGRDPVPGYPKPENIKWIRPGEKDDDYFGKRVELFKANSQGDIIQGKLGDGWFLSAVSIASTRPDLIKSCFWRLDDFRNYGIYCCRFFKNGAWYYVLIDDYIPVFNCSNGQPCFARCAERSELWLPLLEKAYAKLHFSYDSLACGQVDVALREITGLCVERKMMQVGDDTLWRKVREDLDFGVALGCIIQPEEDKENHNNHYQLDKKHNSSSSKKLLQVNTSLASNSNTDTISSVVPSAVRGLEKRHAYGVIGARIVGGKHKIILLHNPWGGFGDWVGKWSKNSNERIRYKDELNLLFPSGELDEDKHNFIMEWDDFVANFTSLITTVHVDETNKQWLGMYFANSKWDAESAGGGIDKETWFLNPKFRMRIRDPQTRIFIQVFLHDRRMEMSKYVNETPFSFSICRVNKKGDELEKPELDDKMIPTSNPITEQPSYTFHSTCSKDVFLSSGDFVVVPHTLERGQRDQFCVFIFHDKPIFVDNAIPLKHIPGQSFKTLWNPLVSNGQEKENDKFSSIDNDDGDQALPGANLKSSNDFNNLFIQGSGYKAKFRAEKAESIKEKLLKIAKQRGISTRRIMNSFEGNRELNRFEFKKRMVALGYSISEVPDKEFEFLANPESMTINCSKIRAIFEQDMQKQILLDTKPTIVQDDLMFRPPAQAEGLLTINTLQGQDLIILKDSIKEKSDFEFRRKQIHIIYTSPILTISSRLVFIKVWLDGKRTKQPLLGIPIAYDIQSGKEYGLVDRNKIELKQDQINDKSFFESLEKDWEKNFSLDYSPLPNQLKQKDNGEDASCYLPERMEYIKGIYDDNNTDDILFSGAGDESFPSFNVEEQQEEEEENNQQQQQQKNSLKNIYSQVIERIHLDSNLIEQDKLRNQEFFKLGTLSKKKRREKTRLLSIGHETPQLAAEAENEDLFSTSTGGDETFATKIQEEQNQESSLSEIVDSRMWEQISNLFYQDILSKAEIIIHHTRQNVPMGYWINDEDEEKKKTTTTTRTNKIYSRIVPICGEAKVRKEQLARSENLESWFNKFDKDQNGKIDKLEFEQALNALGFSLDEDEMTNLINYLDKDADGTISPAEFAEFVSKDDDHSKTKMEGIYLQELLSALASPSINRDKIQVNWSIGSDWFKLHDLSFQLRQLTKTCKLKEHRTAFACDPDLAAVRAYRIAHMFQTSEHFKQFLERTHNNAESYGDRPCIEDPIMGRKVIYKVLSSLYKKHSEDDLNLDQVIDALPSFLEETMGIQIQNGGKIKSGDFTDAIIKSYAKSIVAEKFTNELDIQDVKVNSKEDQEQIQSREEELLAQVMNSLEMEVQKQSDDNNTQQVSLTIAEQVRMIVDDSLIYCKARGVNRSTLARMLDPHTVKSVELKLLHILNQQKAAREGPVCFMVDFYINEEKNKISIKARDPIQNRSLVFDDVHITPEEANTIPWNGRGLCFSIGKTVKNTTPTTHGPTDLWLNPTKPKKEIHFLDQLAERLVIVKATHSNGDRLALAVKECPEKVQFVRELLDSCEKLPFFYQVSETNVTFLVDQGNGHEIKNKVLHALRTQHGNRIARSLSELNSVLTVSFEQTHGDFKEQMTWDEFGAYLAEKRNSYVKIEIKPQNETFTSKVAKDGGFNPQFESQYTMQYTPVNNVNRNLVLTRVCRIEGEYVILFVHHILEEKERYGIVAYNPKSNDEFRLMLKTLESSNSSSKNKTMGPFGRQPALQLWGSPKRRRKKGFNSSNNGKHSTFDNTLLQRNKNMQQQQSEETKLYDPETLRMIENYPIFQEKDQIVIGNTFPLHDDVVWDKILEHFKFGECLTPHVQFTVFNKNSTENDIPIGKSRFPLSMVTNNPGQLVDRWLNLVDEEKNIECGKLHITFRFDDVQQHKKEVEMEEESKDEDMFKSLDDDGDESFAITSTTNYQQQPPVVMSSTNKEYAILAQRLRDEISETKMKLVESERKRFKLEDHVKVSQEKLLTTRSELELQRRKLDEAEALVKSQAPYPPKRGSDPEQFEKHAVLSQEHAKKLREIEVLKAENNKLRHVTDARENRLREDLLRVRKQLEETEIKYRMEVSEKQELLHNAQKISLSTTTTTTSNHHNNVLVNRKSKMERDSQRNRREQYLKDRLGREYSTYKNELDSILENIVSQLSSRRPKNPAQPIGSLEKLMLSSVLPNQRDAIISAECFQESILDFGISIKPQDMEMLITHFDTNGNNSLSVDEFIDSLKEHLPMHEQTIAAAGFRGVQSVQHNKYGRKYNK